MVEIINLLVKSRRVVALTGMGISIPSASDEDYFNKEHREIFSIDSYQNNFEIFNRHYFKLLKLNDLSPNIIHTGLAKLDARVITQNIDRLHELAGSEDPIHLHGKINEFRCINCKRIYTFAKKTIEENKLTYISCEYCNCNLRPNIVLFGEPVHRFDEAVENVLRADLLLVIGASTKIWPANNLIKRAQSKNNKIINLDGLAEPLFNQLFH